MKKEAYIWSLPTRIFHWLLVFYMLMMYITSEEESWLDLHAAFGYGIGVLVLFRIVWGFVGPQYVRFSNWPLRLAKVKEYLFSLPDKPQSYVGHNPPASFVMLAMIAVTFFAVLTGVLTYGIQEGRGLLGFLNSSFFKEMELFEEVHEFFSTFMLLLIFAHMAGLLTDYFVHKEEKNYLSMFSGRKSVEAAHTVLNGFQKIIAVLFLSLALITPLLALQDTSVLTKTVYEKEDYSMHTALLDECASCHILYPPAMLPKHSWKKLMANLAEHFGDDASIDEETAKTIETFLVANSAEASSKEYAYYFFKSIEKKDIISVTETEYWKMKHKEIEKSLFESKKVRTKANCKACHPNIENALIEDHEIKVPKV